MACNIIGKINRENIIYMQSREIEVNKKYIRESWDKGEKELKWQVLSLENSYKILRCNRPKVIQPANEISLRPPQHEKMWNTLQKLLNIRELSKRIFDMPILGVTIRELLSILLDLIQQWFGMK